MHSIRYSIRGLIAGQLMLLTAAVAAHQHHPQHNMEGVRGIVTLDWPIEHISRVLSAGYPESFTLSSFLHRTAPGLLKVDGKQCIRSNFIAFDVDDTFAFDIDETVQVDLLFYSKHRQTLFYAYDRNGLAEAIEQITLAEDTSDGWHAISLNLERARFANRGMAGTDIALLPQATMLSTDSEASDMVLCEVSIRRSHKTQPAAETGILELTILEPDSGEPTPVRLGIYDETGRTALPSEYALPIRFYDSTVSQLILSSYNQRSQPWPSSNRYVMYSSGVYKTPLPAGEHTVVIAKGPEYRWIVRTVEIEPDKTTELILMLDRWTDLPAAGWYSGDVHIHIEREREDNDTIMEFLKAEDVHVSNLLLATNTGERHFNQYAFGEEGIHQVATHAIVPGIEGPRTAQRGHIIALNIAEPIIDLKNYFHYHKFMQGYADQGGLSGYAHVGSEEFNASWGLALDVPFGLVDFVEVMQNSQLRTEIWYQFLGLGYQLAPAAGSDFPYFDQPGAIRNYARIDGDFSTEGWFDALRRGDTFVTNGPVLELLVNGEPPGASLSIAATEALDVVAHASINPDLDELASLELVYCGETIASTDKSSAPTYALALASQLEANQGGWLALKVTGKSYAMAHSAPVYIQDENGSSACQAQVDELAELMLDRLAALQNTRPDQQRELEYWETANVHALYNAQLPALTARIEQAAAIYREMIVKTPVR